MKRFARWLALGSTIAALLAPAPALAKGDDDVIDLGNLSLSDMRTTVITSPSFAYDSCLSKAEVDISYTDASGAYVTVNESIRVR